MPIPKNWLEELALEWLLLEGYVALSNVRLKSGKGGGTKEADVIGLKLIRKDVEGTLKEVLEIKHVETGSLGQNFEENLKSIKNKFELERLKTIKDLSLDIIELESVFGKARYGLSRYDVSEVDYRPVYVAKDIAKIQVDKLRDKLKKTE